MNYSVGLAVSGVWVGWETNWWTWKPEEVSVNPGHFFATWGLWAAFAYPAILLAFLASGTPGRQLRRGVLHAIAYTVGLILISGAFPLLRNFIVFPIALGLMLSMFSRRGPELRSMRRAPGTDLA